MAQILGHYRKVYGSGENLELFYNDNLGSRRVVVNNSDSLLDLFTYSTWGSYNHLTGPNTYLASFTGKSYDDTNLVYFNARYYDPTIGRFLTEDSIKKGSAWFTYCGNDPINRIDTNGKDYFLPGAMENFIWTVGNESRNVQKAEIFLNETLISVQNKIAGAAYDTKRLEEEASKYNSGYYEFELVMSHLKSETAIVEGNKAISDAINALNMALQHQTQAVAAAANAVEAEAAQKATKEIKAPAADKTEAPSRIMSELNSSIIGGGSKLSDFGANVKQQLGKSIIGGLFSGNKSSSK